MKEETTETETPAGATDTGQKLAIKEENGLLHITVNGNTYVATQKMLESGQFLPLENVSGLRRYFDGRLNRWLDGHWTWLDGEKEERVKLITVGDHYHFNQRQQVIRTERVVTQIGGISPGERVSYRPIYDETATRVEIPEPLARGYNDLAWVLEGNYELVDSEPDGSAYYSKDDSHYDRNHFSRKFLRGEVLPLVYLVRVEDWQKHAKEVVGITWAATDEDAILSKARGLGWKEPEREGETVGSEAKVSTPTAVSNLDQYGHVAPQFS